MIQIQPGNILRSSFWPEKVRVISVKTIGKNQIRIEAVGLKANRYYNPVFSEGDLRSIEILEEKPFLFLADGESLFPWVEKRKEGEVRTEEPKVEHKAIGGVRYLTLEAKIPWDKLSSIISGLIRPLKDKGSLQEIIVEIKAEAEQEFDRTTLDTRVKETLNQIGAKIRGHLFVSPLGCKYHFE